MVFLLPTRKNFMELIWEFCIAKRTSFKPYMLDFRRVSFGASADMQKHLVMMENICEEQLTWIT